MASLKRENLTAYICRNDRIEVAGQDISHLVSGWRLVQNAGDLRTIELDIIPDDTVTINGQTIADMLG